MIQHNTNILLYSLRIYLYISKNLKQQIKIDANVTRFR
jgi:hypothetical protein